MGTIRNAPVLPESPELIEMHCAIETGQFFYFLFFFFQMSGSLNQNLAVLQDVERMTCTTKMDIWF